ncbi:MAG: 50S ribosomal protein L13 [Rhodospirillales bacterium]
MKTYVMKAHEVEKKWVVIDAEGVVLGRLASQVATILRGKHRPSFTANADCGDNVIVVNAEKVRVTGRKLDDKLFRWHTNHPGGLKTRTMGDILGGRFPERAIEKAVERMMPRGPRGRQQMRNMRVYAGPEHPHEAQQPATVDIAGRNPKNQRKGK